jgi:hypothetical protein
MSLPGRLCNMRKRQAQTQLRLGMYYVWGRDESLSLVRNDSTVRQARCHFGTAQLHSKWWLWPIQFSVPHRGAGTFACVLLMHTPGGQMCRTGRDIAVHADGSSFVCLSEGLM